MILRMSSWRKSQFFVVILFTFIVTTFYYLGFWEETLQKTNIILQSPINVTYFVDEHDSVVKPAGFAVYTPGCRIPELHPFDKSVLKYLTSSPTVQCSDKLPLVLSDQTSVWVDTNVLESYNVSNVSDLNCCYSPFARATVNLSNIRLDVDDLISMYTYCRPFKEWANIYHEFVQITCSLNGTVIYKDYHAFVVPKKRNPDPGFEREPEGLSVLIVGVDSLSRANFYRQMPKTKDLLHSMGAIEFYGYNKVQDNTFPNLVPLLSSFSVEEIRKLCWFNDSDFFDDCPWIWKNFSAQNYYTAFAEDCVNIGLFNYLKYGFLQSPTDYYLRPYIDANERFIGHMKLLNTNYCVGSRVTVDVLMDYAYKFCVNMTLEAKKFWGFFWESSLTHDYLNVPANNDNIYFEFFRKLIDLNILNNTMVIFMSDHGMRWGSIRETYQGRMEEHLPFLFLIFPEHFREKYNLAFRYLSRNTHLLTTHFDLHETMMDMLNVDALEDEALEDRILKTRNDRGISLFLPIPMNRTCESAGIPQAWCTCQISKRIGTTGKNVRRAAKVAVYYLNMLLSDYKQCAQLKLKKILSALQENEGRIIKAETKGEFSDFIINFETKPGPAKFEATVRHRPGSDEMVVLGDISRINIYGNQSECVPNYRLKRYCFCI